MQNGSKTTKLVVIVVAGFVLFSALCVNGLAYKRDYDKRQAKIAKDESAAQERKDDIEKIKKDPDFYLDKTEKLVSVFGDYPKAKIWMSKLEEAIPDHSRMKPLRKEYEKLREEKDSFFAITMKGMKLKERPKEEARPNTLWYKGGVLFNKAPKEWLMASSQDQLSTSAAFLKGRYQKKGRTIHDVSKLKEPALKMNRCINNAIKTGHLGAKGQKLSYIAAYCVTMINTAK